MVRARSSFPNLAPLLTSRSFRSVWDDSATVENPSPSLRDQHGSSSVPIYQTATFKGMDGQFDYSRSGNPTRSFLGELAFSSSLLAVFRPPDILLVSTRANHASTPVVIRAPPEEDLLSSVGSCCRVGNVRARPHPPTRQARRHRPRRGRPVRWNEPTARMARNRWRCRKYHVLVRFNWRSSTGELRRGRSFPFLYPLTHTPPSYHARLAIRPSTTATLQTLLRSLLT